MQFQHSARKLKYEDKVILITVPEVSYVVMLVNKFEMNCDSIYYID